MLHRSPATKGYLAFFFLAMAQPGNLWGLLALVVPKAGASCDKAQVSQQARAPEIERKQRFAVIWF
jgi:hypothetical protein